MNKKCLLGIAGAMLLSVAFGNAASAQTPPQGAVPSLLDNVNPRAAGMGLAATATKDNPFGVFGNESANLFSEKRLGFGYSYNPFMPELHKGSATHAVGGYFNIDDNNGISFGFRDFRSLSTVIAGKEYRPNDLSVSLAYSRRIVDNFAMSLTARYVRSDYSSLSEFGFQAGNAVVFDLGFYYENTIDSFFGSTWAVGMNINNVGTKIEISPASGPQTMPAFANLGGSLDMPFSENHKLLAALDFTYVFLPSTDSSFMTSFGLEYNFFKYGIVRAGYHYGDKNSIGGSYATVGLGVKAGPVRVDGAYWIAPKDSPVKNSWTVGLSLFF